MATSASETGTLNEREQLALSTYTAVTNQASSQAIPLLRRSEWNVQIAIAKFFDGEGPDPLEEARASLASPPSISQSSHRETLVNGSPTFQRPNNSVQRDPAPRIVPQAESHTIIRSSPILTLLFAPFNILFRIFSVPFRLLGHIFPFLPRLLSLSPNRAPTRSRLDTLGRKPLNPRDTAARFSREFEEEYGNHSLPFFENGYAQAYDLAKNELKFLLVVLISPEHDDTSSFVRETLLSEEFVNYINHEQTRVILWAGNVQDSEAYQVSTALNCSKFPFSALIAQTTQDSSTLMSTIARVIGPRSPSTYVSKLQAAISQHSPYLNHARAAREEQRASQNLRNEQNSAYERSLAQDRERARKRREAEAAEARAKQEAKSRAEAENRFQCNLEQWRRWRANRIAKEPSPNSAEVTRVSIRLMSGERVVRRFPANSEIEEIYAFVDCYGVRSDEQGFAVEKPKDYNHEYKFSLVSSLPRTIYRVEDGGSIGNRFGRNINLIVEPIGEEDEVDEEEKEE